MARTLPLTTKTPDGYSRTRARRGTSVVHLTRYPSGIITRYTACGLERAQTKEWPRSSPPRRCCGTCWATVEGSFWVEVKP